MSDKNSDAETNYINQAHLDAAKKNISSHPGQSSFDNHYYSDKYYLSPENQKNRILENIRQTVAAAVNLEDPINHCLQTGEYEFDDEGHGAITRAYHKINNFTKLAAEYSYKFSDRKISPEIQELIDKLYGKMDKTNALIDSIRDQKVKPYNSIPSNFYEFIDKGDTYIEHNQEYFIEKYGDPGKMWFEAYIFQKEFKGKHLITDEIFHKMESLKEHDEYEIKKKNNLLSCNSRAEKILAPDSIIESEDAIILIDEITHSVGLSVGRSEIERQLVVKQKMIFEKLKSNLIQKPDSFESISNESLSSVLKDDELMKIFVEKSSDDKFQQFLVYNYSHHLPLDVGYDIFQCESAPEKQQIATNLFFEKIKKIVEKKSTTDINSQVYILGYRIAENLKTNSPEKLVEYTVKLIDSLPKFAFFESEHEKQVNLFAGFLEQIFISTLDVVNVDHEKLEEYVNKFGTEKERYPEMAKKCQFLMEKIRKKFNLADPDTIKEK